MSPLGTISGSWQSAPPQAFSRLRIAQKPNVDSGLHNGNEAETKPRKVPADPAPHRRCPVPAQMRVCRFSTRRVWSHLLWRSLLGQIMPDPESAISRARAAYGLSEPRASLLFDAHL